MNFDAVARDMEEAKSGYIGSATLIENFDTLSVMPAVAGQIAQTSDIRLKEVVRDFATGKRFRRDLFRRGTDKPLSGELEALLDEMVLIDLGRKLDESTKIHINGAGSRSLNMTVYRPVLERLRSGPYPVAELRRSLGGQVAATREVVAVLCAADYAHPALRLQLTADDAAATQALNRAISLHNRQGGGLTSYVAPRLGTALNVEVSETIICEALAGGVPRDLEPVVDHLGRVLVARGLMPAAAASAAEQRDRRAALLQVVDDFVAKRAPLFQRCGILAEPSAG